MSDPSIQTFCCHKPNDENPSLGLLLEFETTAYNTICLISSLVGIAGAIYQLLPRMETLTFRWFSPTAIRGRRIIIWLALADLLASLGVFMRSIVKLNRKFLMTQNNNETFLCIMLAAWIEYFYVVTWFWTLCYAIDMWQTLKQNSINLKYYHAICWTLPAILTCIGLTILYVPNADCHSLTITGDTFSRLLPNYFVTYLPIATVMLVNPILYMLSVKSVHKLLTNCLNQFTRKERDVLTSVKIKFGFINLAFYLCWIPNLLNGIIMWTLWYDLPETILLVIWYTMAVTNPLQALFNSIVYKRTNQKIVIPFSMTTPGERSHLLTEKINY